MSPLASWQKPIRESLRGLDEPTIRLHFGPWMAHAYARALAGSPPLSHWPSAGTCILAAREGYAQYMQAAKLDRRIRRELDRRRAMR